MKTNLKIKIKHSERLVALFCMLLVLVCTIAFCLPHSHCDHDIDCRICGMFRMLGAVLVALYASSLLAVGNSVFDIGDGRYPCLWLMRENSPIGLKVKLTN